jgi:hypothetical protein
MPTGIAGVRFSFGVGSYVLWIRNSDTSLTTMTEPLKKLWLWKNFVNGRPEYWAFDNPYPCFENGDPITLGEPCGYALIMGSVNGRPEVPESQVIEAIKNAREV